MSLPTTIADNVERTKSLDPILSSTYVSLPNGESYSGSLLGNTPEGSGSYSWSDGCTYEGEWRLGLRQGLGNIHWASGSSYKGEFAGGYMHGTGTYTRSDGAIYNGLWRLSLKHGLGCQIFSNGDSFEGLWINGAPEGLGKYMWCNGNVYSGNMKGGKMSGKGKFNWTNGDFYEGSWEKGKMHGFGAYTYSDGGCFVGTWTRGVKDGKGTFYPNGTRLKNGRELYSEVFNGNRSSQKESGDASFKKSWSFNKIVGKVRSSSVPDPDSKDEGVINPLILEREYMQGVLISELVITDRFPPSSGRGKRRKGRLKREMNRPGEQIIKGHRSYDLMLSLQLGIRYTVGKIIRIQSREALACDFGPRATFCMNFPKDGSQLTPPHQSDDFRWKDYCPMVFRDLREMFKIDTVDYMMSICGSDALRELSSPGKSGSVFLMSQDDRFMIKTLRKSEVKVLVRMLPSYHQHVTTYDNTLVTKFFGLHRIIPSSGQKFRFVVMGNMFYTELRIHRIFDLKGSSCGRSADKVEIDENTILKDLDLNYCFYLEPSWQDALLQQIEIDSKFLESQNIMDYSLLLGVHYRAPHHLRSLMSYSQRRPADGLGILAEEESMEDEISPQGLVLVPRRADDNNVVVGPHIRGRRLKASSPMGNEEVDLLLPGTARLQIQLGVNMPARAECIQGKDDEQEMFHEVYDVVLYMGIIDILQEYNISKKIEHAYKSIQFNSGSISAVDPTYYSERFLDFIQKIFPPNSFGVRSLEE